MGNSVKYIANSFVWSSISKILNAGLRFVSIPLLLGYFGKENYGIIALAVSVNAYMQLLDMGMNTGAVKYFSQWIALKDYARINRVSHSNITFYAALGLINSIILLLLAWKGSSLFKISAEEFSTFRQLLYILAGTSIINWTIFVFNQLLIADEKMAFTQQVMAIRNVLNLAVVLLAIYLKWSIVTYFFWDAMVNMSVFVPYYLVCKRRKLVQSLVPAFYWKDFSLVFKYSLTIFIMSLFQFSATQSRPLVLGIFSNQGVSVLSDYRVIEVFPLFIISIGGMMISILLPKTSRAILQNDRSSIEKMVYQGTKYTSILASFLCFPIMLCAKELLSLYVGINYGYLSIWLVLWLFTLTLFLHNTPVASLVLATGKTKMLVYSSAIACIVSVIINIILCDRYGVGSAVIGYLVYIIIQVSFYYLYFNKKILNLQSFTVFKSFIIPTGIGFVAYGMVFFINFSFVNSGILLIMLKSVLWSIIYILMIFFFRVLDIHTIQNMLSPENINKNHHE